jgi:hypothetical protein
MRCLYITIILFLISIPTLLIGQTTDLEIQEMRELKRQQDELNNSRSYTRVPDTDFENKPTTITNTGDTALGFDGTTYPATGKTTQDNQAGASQNDIEISDTSTGETPYKEMRDNHDFP